MHQASAANVWEIVPKRIYRTATLVSVVPSLPIFSQSLMRSTALVLYVTRSSTFASEQRAQGSSSSKREMLSLLDIWVHCLLQASCSPRCLHPSDVPGQISLLLKFIFFLNRLFSGRNLCRQFRWPFSHFFCSCILTPDTVPLWDTRKAIQKYFVHLKQVLLLLNTVIQRAHRALQCLRSFPKWYSWSDMVTHTRYLLGARSGFSYSLFTLK